MPLALQANDAEDLEVISTCLQDAVGLMGDLAYLPKQRRFAILLNRFRWEIPEKESFFKRNRPTRVRAGLHFDGVMGVKSQNLPMKEKDFAFELLAVGFAPSADEEDPSGTVEMDFAGGGTLRIEVECIDAFLADIGEPWAVKSRPRHEDT